MTVIKMKMNLESYLSQEIYNSQKFCVSLGRTTSRSKMLNFN